MLSIAPVSDSVSLVNITPAALDETVFNGIAATIKKTASSVAEALDDLSDKISDEGMMKKLDIIDGNMLTACSELLVPEVISSMRLPDVHGSGVISISETVIRFMEELSYIIASENISVVTFDKIKPGLTARMNKDALRLLMMEFISGCLDGEFDIHGITPSLRRADGDKILLELSCGYLGRFENKVLKSRAARQKGEYDPARMLREEMERIYGCHISCRHNDMVSTLSVEMRFEEAESGETLGNRM